LDLHSLPLLVLDLDARPDADSVVRQRCFVDDDRAVAPVAQHPDTTLEQALLVLRSVVLEVLRKVAIAPRSSNSLHGFGASRALELGELRLELLLLRLRQMIDLVVRHEAEV